MSTSRYIYTFYTDPPRAFPEAAVPEAAVPKAAVPKAAAAEAEVSPEVEPESRSHWDLHWKTLRQHTEIKRYERKRARLLKNADPGELAKAYEKHPKLYAELKRKLAEHMNTDQKKYLKCLKKEYTLLKKALSRARE